MRMVFFLVVVIFLMHKMSFEKKKSRKMFFALVCLGLNEPCSVAWILLPPTRSGHIEFGSITESLLRFECVFKPACLLYVDFVVSIEFIESFLCVRSNGCVCVCECVCASCMLRIHYVN